MAVVSGATIMCPFGSGTASFNATNSPLTRIEGKVVGNIADGDPNINIPTFGMCNTLSNPQVAAATAAAMGVLTPQPCVPVTKAWIPESVTTLAGAKPVLTQGCTCMCAYGGTIKIVNPGQQKVVIG
jgi:hypothetical protein